METDSKSHIEKVCICVFYPFWFFFSKTWLGNLMMLFICVIVTAAILGLIFLIIPEPSNENAPGIAFLGVLLVLPCTPYVFGLFCIVDLFLEEKYKAIGFKINFETNWW